MKPEQVRQLRPHEAEREGEALKTASALQLAHRPYEVAFVIDALGSAQVIADARPLVERVRIWLHQQGLS